MPTMGTNLISNFILYVFNKYLLIYFFNVFIFLQDEVEEIKLEINVLKKVVISCLMIQFSNISAPVTNFIGLFFF